VQRLLKPLMTAPSQLLAVGEVVASDLGSPSITQATTTSADDDSEPPSLSPDCPLQSAGSSSEKRTGMVYLDALADPGTGRITSP
jgi:hypothetical protein